MFRVISGHRCFPASSTGTFCCALSRQSCVSLCCCVQNGSSDGELLIKKVQLKHAGRYTCTAQTPIDNVTVSAQLVVRGESLVTDDLLHQKHWKHSQPPAELPRRRHSWTPQFVFYILSPLENIYICSISLNCIVHFSCYPFQVSRPTFLIMIWI